MLKRNKKELFEVNALNANQDMDQLQSNTQYDAAIKAYTDYQTAAKQRDQAYTDLIGREDFAYNVNNDAMYDKLVKEYAENASMAAEDAMGKAVAMTGGYGNTYAQQVAQQTYQDYMGGLSTEADKLYDRALDRYLMQGDLLKEKYDLATDRVKDKYADYAALVDAEKVKESTPETVVSNITSEMESRASSFDSNDDLANWAYGLSDSGVITEEEADQLIATYMDYNEKYTEDSAGNRKISFEEMAKSDKGWIVDDKGGVNWFGGVDNNVIVIAPNGEKIRLDELVERLKEEGVEEKEAKDLVKKLQKKLKA